MRFITSPFDFIVSSVKLFFSLILIEYTDMFLILLFKFAYLFFYSFSFIIEFIKLSNEYLFVRYIGMTYKDVRYSSTQYLLVVLR